MPVESVIDRRRKDLGGFEVGRVLPDLRRRMVGPFVFFDHMGPAEFPAGLSRAVDVRPHPHIGLATITYLFDGEIMHRDSLGSEQPIRAGEVNWMVAGRGITHSERFERARLLGDRLHGIQTWVALPEDQEETHPSFSHHVMSELPGFEYGGLAARLVAGKGFGAEASTRTLSPMLYAHWVLQPGTVAGLPDEYPERAAYIASGEVEVEGRAYIAGQMLVFAAGGTVAFRAVAPSIVMLLGGEPLGPRYLEWNFVSSSKERIAQAKADWRAGRMKLPDGDREEFIPLPDDPPPPPDPMP
jgi:redox-sensitive bicupin YhaK (pirin superfamily)